MVADVRGEWGGPRIRDGQRMDVYPFGYYPIDTMSIGAYTNTARKEATCDALPKIVKDA